MPFSSTAQRAYLAIHNPKVAHEFAAATLKGAKLPHYAPKKGRRAPRHAKMQGR